MRLPLGLLALVVSAGAPPRFASDDLKKLTADLKAMQEPTIPPDEQEVLLIGALGELDLHRSEACRNALTALNRGDPAARALTVSQVPLQCEFSCRSNEASVHVRLSQRVHSIAESCPKPDPLEGIAQRDQMSPGIYVLLRGLVEQTRTALDADGSPEAKAARTNLDALLPKVVAADAKEFQARSAKAR